LKSFYSGGVLLFSSECSSFGEREKREFGISVSHLSLDFTLIFEREIHSEILREKMWTLRDDEENDYEE
jgi:hypothetical protein